MERPGLALGQTLFTLLLIGGAIWLIAHVAQSRQSKQASQARWNHALQVCSTNPEFKLGHVTNVVAAYPQRGTKAWITWYGANAVQDTWFEQSFPPLGSWVVVSGSPGYGPYDNPQTFYVNRVHDVII